jgi:pimeloyl-ACP methyl ester carboxylesterase
MFRLFVVGGTGMTFKTMEQIVKPWNGYAFVLPRSLSIKTLADAARKEMDRVYPAAEGPVHVVGISLGGPVALSLPPDRCASITLLGALAPPHEQRNLLKRGWLAHRKYKGDIYDMTHEDPSERSNWSRLPYHHSVFHVLAARFSQPADHWSSHKCDIYMFYGERDVICPPDVDGKYIRDHLPNVRKYEVLRDCGHAVHHDRKDVLQDHLNMLNEMRV